MTRAYPQSVTVRQTPIPALTILARAGFEAIDAANIDYSPGTTLPRSAALLMSHVNPR
jgi:hypothetical protein